MIVVDASVAVQVVLDEPGSAIAMAALRARTWSAPDLIFPECANIIWKRHRLGEIDAHQADEAVQLIEALNMYTEPSRRLIRRASGISRSLDHSAYDCFYLAHAEDLQAPLLTADTRLINKVRQSKDVNVEMRSLPEFAKEIGL